MTAYQSPFSHNDPGCLNTADDGTWLSRAERGAEALRATVSGLRALTTATADGIDPHGAPATALREEAQRLARLVQLCLTADIDPRQPTPPHDPAL